VNCKLTSLCSGVDCYGDVWDDAQRKIEGSISLLDEREYSHEVLIIERCIQTGNGRRDQNNVRDGKSDSRCPRYTAGFQVIVHVRLALPVSGLEFRMVDGRPHEMLNTCGL
jgi:hypothetical protein